jgi:hypothetical protein
MEYWTPKEKMGRKLEDPYMIGTDLMVYRNVVDVDEDEDSRTPLDES